MIIGQTSIPIDPERWEEALETIRTVTEHDDGGEGEKPHQRYGDGEVDVRRAGDEDARRNRDEQVEDGRPDDGAHTQIERTVHVRRDDRTRQFQQIARFPDDCRPDQREQDVPSESSGDALGSN